MSIKLFYLFITSFTEEKMTMDHFILFSMKASFELLHADIAGIRFLAKSAVDLKCCHC